MPFHYTLPQLTDMTTVQQSVLDQTLPVAITGGPGTGKSVVSIWRHIRNHELETRHSLLLTYNKALRFVLAQAAYAQHAGSSEHVYKTFEWMQTYSPFMPRYDEIIIDEAQDISVERHETLMGLTDHISYGADDEQILYPDAHSTQTQLTALYPNNRPYTLDQNHRNTYEIMRFVKAAMPNRLITNNLLERLKQERPASAKPKCVYTGGDYERQLQIIRDLVAQFQNETHNIGILLPLKDEVIEMHRILREMGINCTMYHHEFGEIDLIENVHVTTLKSSKGIEFDTVIIPYFSNWRENIRNLYTVKENDYYVALTRAKRNLYLLCAQPLNIAADTFDII